MYSHLSFFRIFSLCFAWHAIILHISHTILQSYHLLLRLSRYRKAKRLFNLYLSMPVLPYFVVWVHTPAWHYSYVRCFMLVCFVDPLDRSITERKLFDSKFQHPKLRGCTGSSVKAPVYLRNKNTAMPNFNTRLMLFWHYHGVTYKLFIME